MAVPAKRQKRLPTEQGSAHDTVARSRKLGDDRTAKSGKGQRQASREEKERVKKEAREKYEQKVLEKNIKQQRAEVEDLARNLAIQRERISFCSEE